MRSLSLRQAESSYTRAGTMVRVLAFHQCGPGSIPGLDISWIEVVGSQLISDRSLPG